ncbi:major intrinsically disordered NOTCH2-binding receptor 1-like isoform X1 [Peromyscus leucopus]|uniref:major intrinsically disordered NOTCH2-binding receptor 1-like isoform X1 n=1 Tax=Peromyscus leucopus TaxID=10041 RepID=UPI0010A159F1|nr:major intrinsically disordered NOTCH2-binding receptor 1-like isoform X1 [Peromyscus leucopus]
MKGDMDLSVLPNNNHPDKFLQLDVKSLMRNSTLLQASLARFPGGNFPATQHWQNLVYSQNPEASQRKSVSWSEKPVVRSSFYSIRICIMSADREDREEDTNPVGEGEKNIASLQAKGFGGENPVLPDNPPPSMSPVMKNNPLYGDVSLEEAMEERKKSPSWTAEEYDKHSAHTNLSGQLKENPNDLRFWLGDMYTPGFDTLLKKKKKRNKQSKLCHMGMILLVVASILVTVVTLSALFA